MQAVSWKEGLLEGSSLCKHIRYEDVKCQSQPHSLKVYGKERCIEDRASLRSDSGLRTKAGLAGEGLVGKVPCRTRQPARHLPGGWSSSAHPASSPLSSCCLELLAQRRV